jgi:DinB superfamily
MENAVDRFRELLERTPARLAALNEAGVTSPSEPGKWSKKEILGHLIDSASNNHQRFVRAQLSTPLVFPAYAQNEWVETQAYASEAWSDLVELWAAYNRHLLHAVAQIPEESLGHLCKIGDGKQVTLSFLVEDYVDHLEHHLSQLLDAEDATTV